MIPTPKQTAGNNETMARVKRQFNGKIYQRFALVWNELGPAAAREYLGRFYNAECREECLRKLVDGIE